MGGRRREGVALKYRPHWGRGQKKKITAKRECPGPCACWETLDWPVAVSKLASLRPQARAASPYRYPLCLLVPYRAFVPTCLLLPTPLASFPLRLICRCRRTVSLCRTTQHRSPSAAPKPVATTSAARAACEATDGYRDDRLLDTCCCWMQRKPRTGLGFRSLRPHIF